MNNGVNLLILKGEASHSPQCTEHRPQSLEHSVLSGGTGTPRRTLITVLVKEYLVRAISRQNGLGATRCTRNSVHDGGTELACGKGE